MRSCVQRRGEANYLATTYHYEKAYQLEKTTDPNGITTLYVYNSDNLLQEIIWQGAVIKRYEYNYRNR